METNLIKQDDFLKKYEISEINFSKTNLEWTELERIYNDHIVNTPFLESYLKLLFEKFVKIERVHSVRYRVKDPEHLIEKIIRKKIEEPSRNITFDSYLSELDDIIGVRILHLFKDEWRFPHKYLTSNFQLKENPIAYFREGDADKFLEDYKENGCLPKKHKYGYRSIHYVIQQKILSNIIGCEVQVRTIFEEAWSEIDHTIRYPYDMENPVFKRYLLILNRLAGSADEMGSFLVFLKEHLIQEAFEGQKRINDQKETIQQLQNEIKMLKIKDKSKQEEINRKIEKLHKNIEEQSSHIVFGQLNDHISEAFKTRSDQNLYKHINIENNCLLSDKHLSNTYNIYAKDINSLLNKNIAGIHKDSINCFNIEINDVLCNKHAGPVDFIKLQNSSHKDPINCFNIEMNDVLCNKHAGSIDFIKPQNSSISIEEKDKYSSIFSTTNKNDIKKYTIKENELRKKPSDTND